ncbi:MAG: phosphate acyltransferase [marine benthic group bacterium]|nr:phosphate acyltransferase [Candidatus Benthicola marisminoris]
MIRSLSELRTRAAEGRRRTLAVADPTGEPTLRALAEARRVGIAHSVLVGDQDRIRQNLERLGIGADGFDIVPARNEEETARLAVRLVRCSAADVLVKGSLTTSVLMRAALDREDGLRSGRILSDVFLFPFGPPDDSRLVGITDGGVTPRPTLDQKAQILVNGVRMFHALGVERPRAAVLAAVEKPSPTFPASEHGQLLQRMWEAGEFEDCVVGGPLAMDLALSPEAARLKGVSSPVEGAADLLVFPSLEAANITAKAIEYTVPVEPAHAVVGGTAPILIPSRAESAQARLNAIALGCWLIGGES